MSALQKFIRMSAVEGMFYALMVATAESYALYSAAQHQLSPIQIGLLSTLPLFLGALAQWIIPSRVSSSNMKRAILISFFVQVLGLLGLWICSLHEFTFFPMMGSLVLYYVGGQLSQPLWFEWMQSQIHPSIFRMYLSRRNAIVMWGNLVLYLLVSYVLMKILHVPLHTLFFVGFMARIVCFLFQYALSYRWNIRDERIRFEMCEEISKVEKIDPKLLSFLYKIFFLTGIFRFCVSVSSPFFLPYMIHDLKFSLFQYVIIVAVPLLSKALFLEGWGRASHGYRPLIGLHVSMFMISIVPYLWSLRPSYEYLLLIEFFSGCAWGGFELMLLLVAQKFVSTRVRTYLGMHMAILNFAIVLGSIVGGLLLPHMPYEMLFKISSIARFSSAVAISWMIFQSPYVQFTTKLYREFMITLVSQKHSFQWLMKRFR